MNLSALSSRPQPLRGDGIYRCVLEPKYTITPCRIAEAAILCQQPCMRSQTLCNGQAIFLPVRRMQARLPNLASDLRTLINTPEALDLQYYVVVCAQEARMEQVGQRPQPPPPGFLPGVPACGVSPACMSHIDITQKFRKSLLSPQPKLCRTTICCTRGNWRISF